MSTLGSPRGLAHLVGSVPLASAEDVFRTVTGALGDCLSRVPDGETGERRRWIWWQREMLERHPDMEVDREAGLLELRQWDGSLLRRSELLRFKPGTDPDTVKFRTGYAEAALASWRLFETLRRRGDVAAGLRFQVALPTPMSSAFMYVSPRSHDAYLRVYERALLQALETIVASIPAATCRFSGTSARRCCCSRITSPRGRTTTASASRRCWDASAPPCQRPWSAAITSATEAPPTSTW